MTFDQLQPTLAALITADAQLSPLGTPIQADPFADPEAAKSAIGAQLTATGVCIEIGFPEISAPETQLGGSTHIEATCEVYVAEQPTITHTLNRLPLVMRVVKAITAKVGVQKPARLRSAESVKTEGGYILHLLAFYVPINLR